MFIVHDDLSITFNNNSLILIDYGCRYGKDYTYPKWAEILGLLMSLSSMVMVPGYAIYYVLTQPGTIMQVSHSV